MPDEAGAVINSTAKVLGTLWNDVSGVSANNQFSAEEAAKAREFSERMSNTQYQRAIADLKAAGLNPASIGAQSAGLHPASTPSANAASASGTGNGGFAGVAMRAIATAAEIALSKGLAAKFSHAAEAAADKHNLVAAKIVHMSNAERHSAERIANQAALNEHKKKAFDSKAFKDHWNGVNSAMTAVNRGWDGPFDF